MVVRGIDTPSHGTHFSIVNVGIAGKTGVTVTLPVSGKITNAGTGQAISPGAGSVTLDRHACEPKAIHVGN